MLSDIEIIAVNDGSTDKSQEIIDHYAAQDTRIITIQQENQGLSMARNAALPYAKGEYIYMMDSDDVLSSPKALQICYEYAEKNNADFIFFDGERFIDDVSKCHSSIKRTHLVEENKKYEGSYLLNLMLEARKHVAWYVTGLPGAANLRRMACGIKTIEDVKEIMQKALEENSGL